MWHDVTSVVIVCDVVKVERVSLPGASHFGGRWGEVATDERLRDVTGVELRHGV